MNRTVCSGAVSLHPRGRTAQTARTMARVLGAVLVLAQVCPARVAARCRPAPCALQLQRGRAVLVSMLPLPPQHARPLRCLAVSERSARARLRHFRSTPQASLPYRARHGARTAARGAEGRFACSRRRREVRRRFALTTRLLSARAPHGAVLTPSPWRAHRRKRQGQDHAGGPGGVQGHLAGRCVLRVPLRCTHTGERVRACGALMSSSCRATCAHVCAGELPTEATEALERVGWIDSQGAGDGEAAPAFTREDIAYMVQQVRARSVQGAHALLR